MRTSGWSAPDATTRAIGRRVNLAHAPGSFLYNAPVRFPQWAGMQTFNTTLPGVLLFEPRRFGDSRGFFVETFQTERYAALGVTRPFIQDNLSRSSYGVLRGLHLLFRVEDDAAGLLEDGLEALVRIVRLLLAVLHGAVGRDVGHRTRTIEGH